MILVPGTDLSRRETALMEADYLAQLPLGARPGSRAWVRQALRLRVAQGPKDSALITDITLRRHYLGRRPTPPRTLILSYLAELEGVTPGPAGAAGMVTIAPPTPIGDR